MMGMKRGYYVHGGDDDAGFAVVAMSVRDAKKIVLDSGEMLLGDRGWIDVRAVWQRNAVVDESWIEWEFNRNML